MAYIIYLFFAVFPFFNYWSFLYTGTTTRSLNLIVLATVLGIWLAIKFWQKPTTLSITHNPVLIAPMAYLVVVTLAGWFGVDFGNSFWSALARMTGVWYLLALALVIWVLQRLMIDETFRRRLVSVIVWSTVVYSVLAFFGQEGIGFFGASYNQEGFTFGNSTFAAMYIFGAWLLAIYNLAAAEVKKWWLWVAPVLIIINPFIISNQIWLGLWNGSLVGEARASAYVILFSIPMLLVVWAIGKIKNQAFQKKVSYGLFAVGVIGFVAAAYSLLVPGGVVREWYLANAPGTRPIIWEIAAQAIQERPIFGWGGDNFERVFENHYDNRLLQPEYNEAWFDRAHNVLVDQTLDNGVVGLIAYLAVYVVIILAMLYSIFRLREKRDRFLAGIIIVYFSLHLLELQTAFDTSISYLLLAVMISLAAILYETVRREQGYSVGWPVNSGVKKGVAVLLAIFSIGSFFWGIVPFARAQAANGQLRIVGSAEKRLPLYPVLFNGNIDNHALLWRTFGDFQRGIAGSPQVMTDPAKVEFLKREVAVLEKHYREYLTDNPDHFRAHLGLADVLIYQMLFGVNKLAEAQTVLDRAIELVPESPQPYWMKAVAYLYMQKFDLARDYAKQGLEINPKIIYSQDVVKYIDSSIKTFPDINLFFFSQI